LKKDLRELASKAFIISLPALDYNESKVRLYEACQHLMYGLLGGELLFCPKPCGHAPSSGNFRSSGNDSQ
jgi:hypothetical protein